MCACSCSWLPDSRRRVRFHELVHDRIHQGLERGIDYVWRHPDRGPAFAIFVTAFDQHPRYGLRTAIEDTHAVVGEFKPVDELLITTEVLAQRHVERVDRTIALTCRDEGFIANLHLDYRHRDRHPLTGFIESLLDIDIKLQHIEIVRDRTQCATRQKFEGCVS